VHLDPPGMSLAPQTRVRQIGVAQGLQTRIARVGGLAASFPKRVVGSSCVNAWKKISSPCPSISACASGQTDDLYALCSSGSVGYAHVGTLCVCSSSNLAP
jgi:hypothetical protein